MFADPNVKLIEPAAEHIRRDDSLKKVFIESYGCAMNFSDSEIVLSILTGIGYSSVSNFMEADVILVNTCSIRENAEQRVRNRLYDFKKIKKTKPALVVGILGCMAERLKSKLLDEEKLVDIVAGPDSYRDLPNLLQTVAGGQKAINVLLSKEETYADISPVRFSTNGISAFISIMRGCDNMCSFCVVPFTRGRERSRDPETIVNEAAGLFLNGYREIILLGQNVDSYLWSGGGQKKDLPGEVIHAALNHQLPNEEQKKFITFAELLEKVAQVHPDLRIRFSTSNPRDMTDAVLHAISRYDNICKSVHLPVQSGSSAVLSRMNRGYTRENYIKRLQSIKQIIPDCGISTDIITGFCNETEEEHTETISLMELAQYDFAYMFKYSERPGTLAAKKFEDDIPEEIKSQRLQQVIDLQLKLSSQSNKKDLNKIYKVLAEDVSKKSAEKLAGRNSQNKVVVFPKENFKKGDYINVLITDCTATTLIGEAV